MTKKLKPLSATKTRDSEEGFIKDTGRTFGEESRDFLRSSLGQGLLFGFGDELESLITGKNVDEIREEIDQYRKDRPFLAYGSEIAGSIPTALLGGAGLARLGVTGAAKVGGLLGGASGVGSSEGDYTSVEGLSEKAIGGALGAGGGALVSKVAPVVQDEAKKLLDKGVGLTTGQTFGGSINKLEEMATSLPFAGSAIKQARNQAKLDFDEVVAKEVLDPMLKHIDVDVSLKGKTGTDLFEETARVIDAGYKKLLPELDLPNKKDLVSTFDDVVLSEAETLTPDQSKTFLKFIDDRIYGKMADDQAISGDNFKQAQRELRKKARDFMSSPNAPERELGEAFQTASISLGQVLKSKNPAQKKALDGLDRSFKRLLPMQTATISAARDGGEFTASQLLSGVRQADKTLRKGDFARGKADLQDLAVAAQKVVPQKLGNSGTTDRLLGAGILGGATILDPMIALPTSALVGGAYQPLMNRVTRNLATSTLPKIRLLAPSAGSVPTGLLSER